MGKVWAKSIFRLVPLFGPHLWALALKTSENLKSVILWNVPFRLASRGFKHSDPDSSIFSRSKTVFWRLSSLQNCNTYVALINVKHSTESKTQNGFNRTTIPWQNTLLLRKNQKCKWAIKTRLPIILCLGDEITIQSSPWILFTAFGLPGPPLSI